MNRLAIRLTVMATGVYLLLCCVVALLWGVNIWSQSYYLLFELCVCLCISKQGVFHCKYIKWAAYAIFMQDCVVCSDVLFDYLPEGAFSLLPLVIVALGLGATTTLAMRHYIKIKRLKRKMRKI